MGNTVAQYLISLLTFLAVLGGFILARRIGIARLKALAQRTDTDLDDLVVELLEKVRWPECLLVSLWAATRSLAVPARGDRLFHSLLLLVLTYRVVTMLQKAAAYVVRKMLGSRGGLPESEQGTARSLTYLVDAVIWILAVVFALGNLGFNISSMLAGLGIGGVAVALAAQAVLGDLFSALAIYLDRPFVAGDFIVAGDLTGTVERIGIKTTRVRALSGEMLIVANSRLTAAQIQNFRQLQERRIALDIRVPYHTATDKVKAVPGLIADAVRSSAKARFDRAHLKAFDPAGFVYEAVYFVTDPDYRAYMDANQDIHLAVLEAFRRAGISFALPARAIFHQGPDAPAV